MSEIVDDLKVANVEVTSNLGLRLSGSAPEIKTTQTLAPLTVAADGNLTLTSTTGEVELVSITGVNINSDGRIALNSTDVLVGNAATGSIGFYGKNPTSLFESGVTGAVDPGTTDAVFQDTTFNGGIIGNNYTINDIVNALKLVGLIAV